MKTAVLCDTESLYFQVQQRYAKRLDYKRYIDYLEQSFGYRCDLRYAYGNQRSSSAYKFIQQLSALGFQTSFKYGKDWHVELILQAISITDKVDCIVLGSNDPVYRPMIPWLEMHGVKVHIVASNIPQTLAELVICHEIGKELLLDESSNQTEPLELPPNSVFNGFGYDSC